MTSESEDKTQAAINEVIRTTKPKELVTEEYDPYDIDQASDDPTD